MSGRVVRQVVERCARLLGPRGFSTRRRLVAAFSVVLAVFLAALAFQVSALRRMEATFAAMEERDRQMQLALQLESAVREQYAHQGIFVMNAGARRAEYQAARAEARQLALELGARLDEPDARRWMEEIHAAGDELDRVFREQVEPAVLSRSAAAIAGHDGSYPLVSRIEDNVDRLFARLQEATSRSRQELVRIQERALRLVAALLVVVPAFVVGAVLYLSRSVARPLARLSRGAAALAAGDLDARIGVDTPDEFGALAAEFNAMTVALKQHQARLVESEKLAGIGRLAAGVAHELNNPLQVMLGYLSLNRDVADPRLSRQLAAAEEEALRCRQIVENLLELSRPGVEAAPVDLRRLCEEVAGGLRVAVLRGRPALCVDGAARALGDRPRLRQVLFNLMRNGLEAAGPSGYVVVRLRAAGDRAEVAVCDTGPGLAPEARARLFEPFFTTKSTGTGLGLAVSRATALAHGGDIEVRNGPAGGAIFTLFLPRAPERRS